MAEPIRIRARVRNGWVETTVLMLHPMETGMRSDESGNLVPLHHITDLQISLAGRVVLSASMGMAVARDPLLQFRFRGAEAGDRITATWTDSKGDTRRDEALITG